MGNALLAEAIESIGGPEHIYSVATCCLSNRSKSENAGQLLVAGQLLLAIARGIEGQPPSPEKWALTQQIFFEISQFVANPLSESLLEKINISWAAWEASA